MTASRPFARVAGVALLLAAAACLSSAPPAPPVRWFDPLPSASTDAPPSPAQRAVRVAAAPHLSRDFAVRVAERELAFDGEHRWIAEPSQLVATVLGRSLPAGDPLAVDVEAFELDITQEPRAHVRWRVLPPGAAVAHVVDVWATASDRSPEQLAAAMAKALADAAAKTAAAVAPAAGG